MTGNLVGIPPLAIPMEHLKTLLYGQGYFGVEVVTGNTILYIETTSGSPFQQTNQTINGQKIE